MTYRIQTKRSNVADLKPHFTELLPGELALNYSDMILYALDSGGNVQQITSGGGGGDLVAMNYTFWVKVVQEGDSLTRFEGTDDNGSDFDVNIEGFDVALNGVSLKPGTDYTIDEFALVLDEPATVGDVVIVRSLEPTDGVSSSSLTTNDIALLGDDTQTPTPQGYKEWTTKNNLRTQQDANWHLKHTIDNLEIPDAIDLPEGLATEEWVTEQIAAIDIPSTEGLATVEYVDGADQAVQRFATAADDAVREWVVKQSYLVDEGQNTQIETLENKVEALEGSVIEAQYRADPRDNPTQGGFVLQDDGGFKALYFNQAKQIEFYNTDYSNKTVDISKMMAGDILRLVMSPTNYANYTITSINQRQNTFIFGVDYGSHGQEDIVMDGAIYDFTHTTPFDVGSAATKQYVDDQDEVTLKAAKDYADSLDIPEAIATDGFLTDSGEQHVQTGWKLKSPPASGEGLWTYFSLANAGEIAINHLRNPSEPHHAANKGWVEDQQYVSTDEDSPLVNRTIQWRSGTGDYTPKLKFSSDEEYSPQSTEKMLLAGNYKSNGGTKSTWSFGYNTAGNYWNYDWAFGSNLTCRYVMGDQNKCVMSIDKTGVDMPSAYIVGDYSLEGVAEEDVEAVKAQAREIDIGHRLRELKNILVNLKTALLTKSADAQQALLDVLENVEDI